jgi:hypothetical protein
LCPNDKKVSLVSSRDKISPVVSLARNLPLKKNLTTLLATLGSPVIDVLAVPIAFLYNLSVSTGAFPSKLKISLNSSHKKA